MPSVHLIHATFQSNCTEGLHFSAFHYYNFIIVIDFYYMHNNNNIAKCAGTRPCMTFGVGSIQLSFHTIVFTQYMKRCLFSIQMLHFSQIALRSCTLVLFIFTVASMLANICKILWPIGAMPLCVQHMYYNIVQHM